MSGRSAALPTFCGYLRSGPDGKFFCSCTRLLGNMFDQHHADDVGRILLQAQNDLKNIRSKISTGNASPVDLDRVLERAEQDLRAKAELVLSAVTQNSAEVLPTLQQPAKRQTNLSGNNRRGAGRRRQTSTSRVRRKVEHARSMEYIKSNKSRRTRIS